MRLPASVATCGGRAPYAPHSSADLDELSDTFLCCDGHLINALYYHVIKTTVKAVSLTTGKHLLKQQVGGLTAVMYTFGGII